MAFHGSILGQPWIFKGFQGGLVEVLVALQLDNILLLDEVGVDLCFVVGKHYILAPLDHLGLEVILSCLLD